MTRDLELVFSGSPSEPRTVVIVLVLAAVVFLMGFRVGALRERRAHTRRRVWRGQLFSRVVVPPGYPGVMRGDVGKTAGESTRKDAGGPATGVGSLSACSASIANPISAPGGCIQSGPRPDPSATPKEPT